MRYVIIRDDDTNATTPPEWLEQLYRPFLNRQLPINLAVIPDVSTSVTLPDGQPEHFLRARSSHGAATQPIGSNPTLLKYLLANPGYCIAQHGFRHDPREFDSIDRPDVIRRLVGGMNLLREAGFARPAAFIAPHDKLSRVAVEEAAKRFAVISTNWFELKSLPLSWWPSYSMKKFRRQAHWKIGSTALLSRPISYLSCYQPHDEILAGIKAQIEHQKLTVLNTHWWEFFRDGAPDLGLIAILHQLADYFAEDENIRVVSFAEIGTNTKLILD